MEYYKGRLCISKRELVDNGIVSEANYGNWTNRERVEIARRGGGSAGNTALVVVESLPTVYRDEVYRIFGKGNEVMLAGWLRDNYERDQAAVVWFNDRANTGIDLKPKQKEECIVNASVLNCCIRLYERAAVCHRLAGESYRWEKMAAAIEGLKKLFGHTLPTSPFRFRKKLAQYRKDGYASLISGRFGNQCARRMSLREERLVLSIACLENQPYNTSVREMYIMFLCGELEVWDYDTGEVLDPETFAKKGQDPWIPSEATIANYLNRPKNKILIEARHRSWSDFYHEQMPHMHRHNGEFSLSQITMDDVDLKRRMKDNGTVHAYYAYDVVSQCKVGAAYGRGKDDALVVECFRDMFRLIAKHGWGMPAGLEVENHLMGKYRDGFLKAGEVFDFVHFCAPLNSQEKYAEPLNSAFQSSIAHKNHAGIGRFYGKKKNRIDRQKVSDASNDTYRDKRYYTFEELVADDRADIEEWNNTLHPNQKKYPGMTRWQVLVANINPTLRPLDRVSLSRYIGERVETSIRRNSTVRVAYCDWWLSHPSVLERLEPNNLKVTAYYLPDENGEPTEVYLYQGDRYIDRVSRVQTYNRVYAEQTDEDRAIYREQCKKFAEYEAYVRCNDAPRIGTMKRTTAPEAPAEAVEIPPMAIAPDADDIPAGAFAGTDWAAAALRDQ